MSPSSIDRQPTPPAVPNQNAAITATAVTTEEYDAVVHRAEFFAEAAE